MKSLLSTLFFIFFLCLSILSAQQAISGIAILDLSERNGETNDARMFSVEHACKVVGAPFVITTDVVEAKTYAMVFCSSKVQAQTFTTEEKEELIDYVASGGVLLAPRVEDEDLFELFGIDGYEASNARYTLVWDNTNPLNDEVLRWINEPEELTMSLGRDDYDAIYKTLGYATTSARTLAHFGDGSSAVVQNSFGEGQAATIGLSLKEIILRSQINRDYEAQRISSNGFEPTTDAFFLFVRGLYASQIPFGVWKNTSPGNSRATVMITHDIDSSTGMDTLRSFVDYEESHNIHATYNVTVRYFDDELMSPFYLNQESTMSYIKDNAQTIASHSAGHFFDFADEDVFPIGESGNTKLNYNPSNDGDITIGGTVYGECEVSKNTLEEDLGVDVRTFRAGHLAYPKYLVNVLDSLGYEFNSSNSAADVLTNFPYQNKMGRSFSGARSNVYELPVTISDVIHSNPISIHNYLDKADMWLDVTLKNRANGAPSVLLIHPNRGYKLNGMIHYLENLPNDIYVQEMGAFGDFWKYREGLNFIPHVFNNEMTILLANDVDLTKNVSFIIKDGQSLDAVVVKDEQNNILDFTFENWDGNDLIAFHENTISTTNTTSSNNEILNESLGLKVFPSPSNNNITIEFELSKKEIIEIDLFDVQGKRVSNLFKGMKTKGAHRLLAEIEKSEIKSGIYFVTGMTASGATFSEKVVLVD